MYSNILDLGIQIHWFNGDITLWLYPPFLLLLLAIFTIPIMHKVTKSDVFNNESESDCKITIGETIRRKLLESPTNSLGAITTVKTKDLQELKGEHAILYIPLMYVNDNGYLRDCDPSSMAIKDVNEGKMLITKSFRKELKKIEDLNDLTD